MGIDGTEFTTGYIEPGIIPMFKILRQDGTLIDLLGGFPAWQNNETFIVSGSDYYSTIPVEFVLDNIYPNPFNPSTNISFAVPIDAHVEISIYDINGRLVKSLVNNVLSAGYYEIEWNASNESSGVYILKMQSDGFIDTQKMMLIK